MVLISILFVGIFAYSAINTELRRLTLYSKNIRESHLRTQKEILRDQVDHVVTYIKYKRSLAEQRVRAIVKSRTEEAYKVALHIYEIHKDKKSLSEIKKIVHDALFAATWDEGRGYYFAEDMIGTELINRNNPELEGTNLMDLRDSKGNYIMRDILKVAKSPAKEGFCSYYWNKPDNHGVLVPKISYVKYFPPFDWVIGNGKYISDEEEQIKEEVLRWVEKLHYGKEGYIFIGNYEGVMLTGPKKGENIIDAKGVKITEKFISVALSGGNFFQYSFPRIDQPEVIGKKLSFVAPIEKWKWYVGAGVYIDEVEKLIKDSQIKSDQRIYWFIGKSLLLLFFAIGLSIYLTLLISRKVEKNIEIFEKFFAKSAADAEEIDADQLAFFEFQTLAEYANQMAKERRKAWGSLQESECRFHRIVEAAHIPLTITDSNGHFHFSNKKFLDLFGYSFDEIKDMEHWWSVAFYEKKYREALRKKWKMALTEAIKTKEPITGFVASVTCKNGLSRIVEFSATFIDELILISCEDITERKQAENEKKQLQIRLNRAKKMEAIGLLAGGVAHDLNNILSGIVGYPELLLLQLPEDSKFRKPIEAILKSGHRAAEVVADLLTVARGIAATKEVANLNQIVNEFLISPEFNKIKLLHLNMKCVKILDSDLLNISCSQVHIKKILLNLVLNAAESLDENYEGEVRIITENKYIDKPELADNYLEKGEYVVLTIKDNGAGISEEDVDRIFEPFYSKKVLGKSGTGLGLSVVWNTVQAHGGNINVESCTNGTAFELYFPATRENLTSKAESLDLATLSGKGEKILIVDDEEQQRDLASKMLELLNYKAFAVPSGEAAIEFCKDNSVDLLLLDMIMEPGINGRETYWNILQIRPEQKAIIASGFSMNDEVKRTQKLGAGALLRKPYTISQLALAVKKELLS